MMVVIYGPNLADQSRGSFHVHADGCGHAAPLGLAGLASEGWAIGAESKAEAVLAIYSDQIHEGASYQSCRDDVFFDVCCMTGTLPEGDAEALLGDMHEEERKGAEDHAMAEAERVLGPLSDDERELVLGSAVGMLLLAEATIALGHQMLRHATEQLRHERGE